jgi:FtsP/CotA-like multicopper oxidase with cupredoxin domain
VTPVPTDLLRLGMGERYDAVVTLEDGVFPFVARRYGRPGLARALVRTASGSAPEPTYAPRELSGYPLPAGALSAAAGTALPAASPDSSQDVVLSGSMAPYVWTINGRTYDETVPLTVAAGQTTRLRVLNRSMMAHPVHLHGLWSDLEDDQGRFLVRKHTLVVKPGELLSYRVTADAPGRWAYHCHLLLHMELGMFREVVVDA